MLVAAFAVGGTQAQTQAVGVNAELDPRAALRVSQAVVGEPIGEHVLLDRDGKPVRLAHYRGKPLLVNFVYTGCFQVCPLTTRHLGKAIKHAQATLGGDKFHVASIGFNLPYDTPAAMREFARRYGVDVAGWDFLSAQADDLQSLVRDFGFTYRPTPKGFDHLTQVTIVDAQGRVFRQVYGDEFELPMLIGPLKELLTGASAPAYDLAAILEKVRLLCTVYDPRSGRYRLNYSLFIEIASGLSIVGATLYVLLGAWWRNRRLQA